MRKGLRPIVLLGLSLAVGATTAAAADCPGNPNALGVSRTIVVDPREHTRIGTMSYDETLPLNDHEVVLTFDDGPLPPYTDRILAILDHECVKATYFMVGSMARAYPDRVRRVYEAGHTIGTHSMTHPYHFKRLSLDQTKEQIDDGIKATQAALGDPAHLAPFFRFPGFARSNGAEEYLAQRGVMAWGADVPADDWRPIGPNEVAKRGLRRLEAMGKGILLLHDIHERTVEALPVILRGLKERGFRVVQVVPATPERSKTITVASQWRMHLRPEPNLPVLRVADASDLSGAFLADRTPSDLCELKTPSRLRSIARAEPRPEKQAARHHIKSKRHLKSEHHFRFGHHGKGEYAKTRNKERRRSFHAHREHAEAEEKMAKRLMPDLHAIR